MTKRPPCCVRRYCGRSAVGRDPARTGGESMRPLRFRGRWSRRILLLAMTLGAFSVFFVAASSGNLTGSTFESTDGNLIKNTGTDWCNTVVSNICTSTAPHLVTGQDKAPGSQTDDS